MSRCQPQLEANFVDYEFFSALIISLTKTKIGIVTAI